MAYSADTFTAGEQPTTAKWNKLWANDAAFNDGTGIADSAIVGSKIATYRVPTRAVSTNTTMTTAIFQAGWDFVNANAVASTTKAVTFPNAFTTITNIEFGVIGARTSSDPVAITDFNVAIGGEQITVSTGTLSTSSVTVQMTKSTNFSSGTRYGFWWRATGT